MGGNGGRCRSFATLRMRGSAPRANRHGFTLLELMVVLVLFAITAVAAVPAFLSDTLTSPEQRTATALTAALAQTRSAARESGAPATLVLSPADGRYWIATRDSSSAGVIPLTGGISFLSAQRDRIECRFEPTGAATPVSITVHGATDLVVRVHAWSGNISIGDGRAS